MKLLILAPLALIACGPLEQQCGPVEAVVISHTKSGFPIYMEPPILPPCDVSRPSGPEKPQPPVGEPPVTPEPPIPPVDDPVDPMMPPEKVKGNNGWGNGDQDAPGNSEFNNGAENRGGNHNGRDESPANSWHEGK